MCIFQDDIVEKKFGLKVFFIMRGEFFNDVKVLLSLFGCGLHSVDRLLLRLFQDVSYLVPLSDHDQIDQRFNNFISILLNYLFSLFQFTIFEELLFLKN
jgi:hypothetical protein